MLDQEAVVRQWFHMWLQQEDTGISGIFTGDAVYIESWGPEYHGSAAIKHWFEEWNTRGRVLQWDIRQFFHAGDQTVVEWYFRDAMNDGAADAFDGISLIQWASDGRICRLQEFGCNEDRYDPYAHGDAPVFRAEKPMWF